MTNRKFFIFDIYYCPNVYGLHVELKIKERDTYEEYIKFCRKNDYIPESKNIFLQNIKPIIKVGKIKFPCIVEIYLDDVCDEFHRLNEKKTLYKDFVKFLIENYLKPEHVIPKYHR